MKGILGRLAHYHAGELAPEGSYWSPRNLRFAQIKGAIDFLPGMPGSSYVRVPTLVALVGALLMGLIYVVALSMAPLLLVGALGVRGATSVFHNIRSSRSTMSWDQRGLL